MSARYVIQLQTIPDKHDAVPTSKNIFFCRSPQAVHDILALLEDYSKTSGDGNSRNSRSVVIVSVDDEAVEDLPVSKRPAVLSGDLFPTCRSAAAALGVSPTYLHKKLSQADPNGNGVFTFPCTVIRGATLAYEEDINFGD